MKVVAILFLFSSLNLLAAPPLVPPSGMTSDQLMAHQKGAAIGIRHSAAQNVIGSRADDYSVINPGSGQARFFFNSTVLSASNQIGYQTNALLTPNFSSVYQNILQTKITVNTSRSINPTLPNPGTQISQVHGMVFIKNYARTSMSVHRAHFFTLGEAN